MYAPLRLLAISVLAVATATACGGGSKTDAKPDANAAAGAAATDSAAGGDHDMDKDDPDEGKIPHGTDLDAAVAAGLGTDGAPVISVTGTDTECTADVKSVKAGKVWVKFTNSGTKINEVYLESETDEKLAEVENITTGKSGGFSFTVEKGKYQLACQPGMDDAHQVKAPLEVTG